MKQYIVFFLLTFSASVYAQDFSVESFTAIPNDLTARVEERLDPNGNITALIKIRTKGMDNNLYFEGGMLGIVDTKQKNGETWIWVPRYSRRLTIMHPQHGIIKNYRYPVEIEGGMTYELVLTYSRISCSVPNPNSNDNSFKHSRNVTVYDKEGNQYTTGLFISTSNGVWVRIQTGQGNYEQYSLTESDKKGFTHMTIGKSEIEPLYIK